MTIPFVNFEVLDLKSFILLLALLSANTSFGADPKTHPANESEFVGYWRVHTVSDEIRRENLKDSNLGFDVKNADTGLGDPCQFVIILASRHWATIPMEKMGSADEARKQCLSTSKKDVQATVLLMQNLSTTQRSWQPAPNVVGAYLMHYPELKKTLIWKADTVDESALSPKLTGFDLMAGDMVMTILKVIQGETPQTSKVIPAWYAVLRPVQ